MGSDAAVLPIPATARLAFAHADWAGYSVFEEAFTRGHGRAAVARTWLIPKRIAMQRSDARASGHRLDDR